MPERFGLFTLIVLGEASALIGLHNAPQVESMSRSRERRSPGWRTLASMSARAFAFVDVVGGDEE
jgi:hypothetical protein